MDKLKKALKFVKRQHFWFLIVLVPLLAIFCWYPATGAMDQEFSKNKGTIESKKTSVTTVRSKAKHPNVKHHSSLDTHIAARRENVRIAWDANYTRQGDILTWPKELLSDFIAEVQKMRPIEQKLQEKDHKPLNPNLLLRYRDYIQKELPKLAAIIDAEWAPDGTNDPVRRPGPEGEDPGKPEKKYFVEWDKSDQAAWKNNHFDWTKERGGRPDTTQVLYAQEDLWVLKALLNIIRQVNGQVDLAHRATIKRVEYIRIGREAEAPGQVIRRLEPADPSAATGPAGVPGARPMEGQRPSMGPMGPMGPMSPGVPGASGLQDGAIPDSADNRYVDEKYQPLPAARLQAIGKELNEQDAHLAVAKRVPVRMRLHMDTSRIHHLLAECANSPLTVDVRQVRLNPGASTGGNSGARPSRGSEGFDLGGPSRGSGGNASIDAYTNTHEGTVEVYGIIYIFNPVNLARLGFTEEEIAKLEGLLPDDAGTTPDGKAAPAAKPGDAPAGQAEAAAPAKPAEAKPADAAAAPEPAAAVAAPAKAAQAAAKPDSTDVSVPAPAPAKTK